MGLLDDAIRDHLDLKRRRGADPAEVERAEREALGPVRRNPTPAELAEADEGAPVGAAPAYDQADEDGWAHDSVREPPADAGVRRVYEEPPAEPLQGPPGFPASEVPAFDTVHDSRADEPFEDEASEEPFEDEEEPATGPFRESPAAPPPMGSGPETAEYNVEDALADEEEHDRGAGGDDDVLEETPEFLQDTPDHDRLWFEQRPPKDFDFDE
jgi:hypothetical protein